MLEIFPESISSQNSAGWARLETYMSRQNKHCPRISLHKQPSIFVPDPVLDAKEGVTYSIYADEKDCGQVTIEPAQTVVLADGKFKSSDELYLAYIGTERARAVGVLGTGRAAQALLSDIARSTSTRLGSDIWTSAGQRMMKDLIAAGLYEADSFGGVYTVPTERSQS